jgi:hypothetical protein
LGRGRAAGMRRAARRRGCGDKWGLAPACSSAWKVRSGMLRLTAITLSVRGLRARGRGEGRSERGGRGGRWRAPPGKIAQLLLTPAAGAPGRCVVAWRGRRRRPVLVGCVASWARVDCECASSGGDGGRERGGPGRRAAR